MEQQMINTVISNSVFGAMFLYLLFYVLKRNDERETKYQEISANLTCKFGSTIDKIKDDVECIKDKVFK